MVNEEAGTGLSASWTERNDHLSSGAETTVADLLPGSLGDHLVISYYEKMPTAGNQDLECFKARPCFLKGGGKDLKAQDLHLVHP